MSEQIDTAGQAYFAPGPAAHDQQVLVSTPQGVVPGIMAGSVAVPLNDPNKNSGN